MIVCYRSPRRSGGGSRLTSDANLGELLDFARRVGIPWAWFRADRRHPHFALSAHWGGIAVSGGAADVADDDYARAVERYRAANGLPQGSPP